ncbi:MAG: sigma-70 family RNA polymerase sigma factor [Pseudomonas sp.]
MDSRRENALTLLFTEHYPWLWNRLAIRLGCRQDAADVASETFVQIIEKADTTSIREPRALLTTIAKRLLYANWRRRDIERAYLQSLATDQPDEAPSAEDRAAVIEALVQVDRLLSHLSSKARYAFLASQAQGMTYAEIATELGVSIPRIHQYVKQGLKACCQFEP